MMMFSKLTKPNTHSLHIMPSRSPQFLSHKPRAYHHISQLEIGLICMIMPQSSLPKENGKTSQSHKIKVIWSTLT
jgi:hypothetical protein